MIGKIGEFVRLHGIGVTTFQIRDGGRMRSGVVFAPPPNLSEARLVAKSKYEYSRAARVLALHTQDRVGGLLRLTAGKSEGEAQKSAQREKRLHAISFLWP